VRANVHFTLVYEVEDADPDVRLLPILRVYCPGRRGSIAADGGLAMLSMSDAMMYPKSMRSLGTTM
jgi:hypothetical protein